MIEDYQVWVAWFSNWQWWNYLLVLCGVTITATSAYGLTGDVYRAFTSRERSQEQSSTPLVSYAAFSASIRMFFNWYNNVDDDDIVQVMIRFMIMPFLMLAMSVIVLGPIFLFLLGISYLSSLFR